MPSSRLEELFPRLAGSSYSIDSESTRRYNCIAWAAEDTGRWWQPSPFPMPGVYWPDHLPNTFPLDSLTEVFQDLGYSICDSSASEAGFEKVAIYVDERGQPTHTARQLPTGQWTSKLGRLEDITHETLEALEGSDYGHVARVLKRPGSSGTSGT